MEGAIFVCYIRQRTKEEDLGRTGGTHEWLSARNESFIYGVNELPGRKFGQRVDSSLCV